MESSREARYSAGKPPFWLAPSAYWLPRHFPTSAWLTHAPFAAWLVDTVRPATIVELGTHYGYSCFTFAEAARRLALNTTINAVDSWIGDDHAGFYGEDVFRYVERVALADYPDSVRLWRGWFSDIRPQFSDQSVDILHIDGRHAYEDVSADLAEWRSTVRDGGLILFHDIAERANGFGVWRLWEELAESGRSFAFEHGHGLGVLSVGADVDHRLRDLFDAEPLTAEQIREDFRVLGSLAQRQAWLESLPDQLDQARSDAASSATREETLAADRATMEQELAALRASTSWRVTAPLRVVGKLRRRR